jgi:hypothetical protein
MWNYGIRKKVEAIFPSDITTCILDVPLFDVVEEGKLVWYDDVHGHYSVKSGYNISIDLEASTSLCKK